MASYDAWHEASLPEWVSGDVVLKTVVPPYNEGFCRIRVGGTVVLEAMEGDVLVVMRKASPTVKEEA